jgi:hypothetical protein
MMVARVWRKHAVRPHRRSMPKPVNCWATPQCAKSAEFVPFLSDIVATQPRGKEFDVIADNLSAHKSQPVEEFLEPRLDHELFDEASGLCRIGKTSRRKSGALAGAERVRESTFVSWASPISLIDAVGRLSSARSRLTSGL